MDRKLIEAANTGDVNKLQNLIRDNPLLLRAVALASADTPLHIACMGGHVNVVKEVLNLRPEFANELNQEGLSPLHIASGNGDIDIVKEVLKVGSHLCLVKGKERRIPLHYAVAKGRIEIIRELLSTCSDSISELTARGETCFHLAVKNNQFEAFKILCEHVVSFDKEDILNNKDEQGNTILHIAASRKQYEVVDLLLGNKIGYKVNLEVNSLNKKGLTPLDVLVSEGGDCEIEEMLSGATTGGMSPQNSLVAVQLPPLNQPRQEQRSLHHRSIFRILKYLKYDKIEESSRNTLLVITALIATATYQAVLSPPGGVWQNDPKDNSTSDPSTKQLPAHTAGVSVMATQNSVSYGLLLVFNSIGFFTSIHMMYFLIVGLPLQFELRVAFLALVFTYGACMTAMTPRGNMSLFFIIFSNVTPLIIPMLSNLVKYCMKRLRCLLNTRISA